MTGEKQTKGIVENFLDDICYPNRDEMIERAQEDRQEQDRAQEEAAIWDDMKCTPKHWEQRTRDIAEQADLEPVFTYIRNQLDRLYIVQMCAMSKNMNNDALGDEFINHISDEADYGVIGNLIKKAVQEAIDEEVSK